MARLITCGWETGSPNEGGATLTGSNWTADTGTKRSGSYSLKLNTGAVAASQFAMVATGAALGTTIYSRFWVRFPAWPASSAALFILGSTTGPSSASCAQLKLSSTGTIQPTIANSAVGSASASLAVDTWHLIEFSLNIGTGAVDASELKVNGTTVYTTTGASYTDTLFTAFAGPGTFAGAGNNFICYFDDFKVNDGSGASEAGYPNAGELALLLPAAESSDGSWTKPGGGTTNTYTSIDNVPPVSIADTTSAGDAEKQLRNPTANDAYALALQSYTAAGVSGTVNGLHPIAVVGAPASTGAKTGSLEGVSNPAITALSFGNYHSGTNAGTFPTGWKYVFGTYSPAPTVTLGTQPVIRLNITGGTTSRIALAAFAGMYAEFTAASGTTYTVNVNVSSSGSLTFIKGPALTRLLSSSGSLTLAKAIALTRSLSSTGSLVATKLIALVARSAGSTGSLSIVTLKSKGVAITVSGTSALVVSKTVALVRSASSTGALTLSKLLAAGRSFSLTSAGALSFTRAQSRFLAFTAPSSGAVTLLRTVGIVRAAASSGAVTLRRSIALTRSLTSTGALTLARAGAYARSFSLTSTGALSLTTLKAKSVAITISATGSLTLARNIALTRLASSSGALAVTRAIALTRSVAGSSSLAFSVGRATLRTFTATSSGSLTVARTIGLVRTATSSGFLTLRRTIALTRTFAGSGALSLSRGLAYARTLTVNGTGALSLSKSVGKSFAVISTGNLALTRAIAKTYAAASTGALTFRKVLGKTFALQSLGALAFASDVVHTIVTVALRAFRLPLVWHDFLVSREIAFRLATMQRAFKVPEDNDTRLPTTPHDFRIDKDKP